MSRSPDPRPRRTLRTLVALATLVAATSSATYVIEPGDTLSAIASAVGTSVRALAQANGIDDVDHIRAGDRLEIPGRGPATGPATTYHVVRPGEALSTIAARYGLSTRELAAANGIVDPDRVLAGNRLVVGGAPAPAVGAAPAVRTHRVAPGETLSHVAARFGVSVSELAAANGISDPDRVIAGTSLRIAAGAASWRCPVPGARFHNDFGVPKHGGRFHEGVDLYAPRGTPVLAPVAGRVEQVDGSRGGRQFWLHGDDGHTYVGTHLDAFGASGRVSAGTQVGTVGTSGNARGASPHLHFEVLPHGRDATNPFPLLRSAC